MAKREYSSIHAKNIDLCTAKNVKKTRYVDNMVDSVDNRMWISHTVFMNTGNA